MAVEVKVESIKVETPSAPVFGHGSSPGQRSGGVATVTLSVSGPRAAFGRDPLQIAMRKEFGTIEQLLLEVRADLITFANELAEAAQDLHA